MSLFIHKRQLIKQVSFPTITDTMLRWERLLESGLITSSSVLQNNLS
jgi:hypothetical protein